MKILSIKFERHPILGNLKLDFVDKNGNPVDTVILAGENGCGKTRILEELYNLWNTNGINDIRKQGQYITTIVHFDQSEIKKLQLPNEYYKNYLLSGLLKIKQDMSKTAWTCYDVEYMDIKDNMWKKNSNLIQALMPIKNSIFSTVDINFHAEAITTITSQNLDVGRSPTRRSDVNLAKNVNQMLVDIDNLDNSDLGVWVDEHPNQPVPIDISRRRIKRFTKAFSFMFTDLSFYKVDNRNNSKTILFKRRNAEIPITQLSSGEKQIIYRGAFFLQDIKLDLGKLVLIDEPEISMHPEWQKKILGYYQKLFTDEKGKQLSQIFIATHSPFIIHNPNRHNDKVIVLKKDDNGNIVQSDKPEYYDCNSCKAIEDSFSVYDFNEDKRKILFAEDKYIQTYKIAWLKLNNVDCDISNFEQKFEDNAPFCIFPSEGAGNLAGLLKCQNIDCYKNKKVIGLFDFDIEGVAQFDNCHNKSFWKDCQIEGNTLSGIYKRRKDHNCFVAMLLPVPIEFIEYNQYGFVSNFVAQEHLLPKSFLESNNLIEDYILPIPNGPTVYKAKDDKKSEIWKKTFDLTKDDFKNFKILFDTLNQIWSSTDD